MFINSFRLLLLTGFFLLFSCSDDNKKSDATDDSGAHTDTEIFVNTDSGMLPGDTDDQFGLLGDTFRFGINGGHRNLSWGDDVQAELEQRAGCNSSRISLPERHLDQWGYEIEVNDMKAYESLGLTNHVAFLTSPVRAHSTAPASVDDGKLPYYIPSNLYEPAVLEDGTINPDNYWGYYVYKTVSIYGKWCRVFEIWNEPDYTDNWSDTLTWDKEAPTKEQLPRFNGSIFEYVRMLRVSMEAARLADPNALIATGGIGYSTFLSAILRYSDNPKDGSITKEYPKSGGEYFDVLSFHHYPIYTDGNSDAGVQGYIDHYTDLNDTLQIAGKEVIGFENTETGAPRYAIDDYPGSVQYARNYLMKVMITAWGAGVHGIDWFVLSDGALEGEGNSSYDYMGLYEDVVDLEKTADAVITPTGVGYETLGMLLDGARYDVEGTKDLQLDNNVKGAAFVIVDGKKAVALWIEDPNGKIEDISKSVDVSLEGSYNRYEWDYSSTNESEEVSSAAGVITLTLSSSVTILVEN